MVRLTSPQEVVVRPVDRPWVLRALRVAAAEAFTTREADVCRELRRLAFAGFVRPIGQSMVASEVVVWWRLEPRGVILLAMLKSEATPNQETR